MRFFYSYTFACCTRSFLIAVMLMPVLFAKAAQAKPAIVHSAAELTAAVAAAKPGDEITIANGTYQDFSCKLEGTGAAGKFITIKPQTAGGVVFSGTVNQTILTITGAYIQIAGLAFKECGLVKSTSVTPMLVELKGESCRLTACKFEKIEAKAQFMPIVAVTGNGKANRIDHCIFAGNINNMDVQVRVTASAFPLNTLIDHNEFSDKARVTWPIFNGGECVQIGQDPVLQGTQKPMATVRDNRFIRCKGEPEVISNKSSGNKYINNYLEDCEGELVMRGGHNCLIDSNTLKGGNCGIRINGSHHNITNNTITGTQTGIRLMYGMARGTDQVGFYIAATDCSIRNNKISNVKTGILVGDSKGLDWTGKFDVKRYPSRTMQDVPPADNEIKDNTISQAETPLKQVDATN